MSIFVTWRRLTPASRSALDPPPLGEPFPADPALHLRRSDTEERTVSVARGRHILEPRLEHTWSYGDLRPGVKPQTEPESTTQDESLPHRRQPISCPGIGRPPPSPAARLEERVDGRECRGLLRDVTNQRGGRGRELALPESDPVRDVVA